MRRTIDEMDLLLNKHNITVPTSARKVSHREEIEEHEETCHALKASCSTIHAFLIDYGASNNMVASRYSSSSMQYFDVPSIPMGNNGEIQAKGKGFIKLEHGKFKDVLYVPSLVANLLFVYQMTHSGSLKQFIFGPNLVEIIDISTGNIIAKGAANHDYKEYEFSHFLPFSEPVHSQHPLAREGKNISSTSFVVSTSIAYPVVSIYEIEIQGDSNPDPIPSHKWEARKMTGNPSDT